MDENNDLNDKKEVTINDNNDEVMKNIPRKGNYITGTIGAILGGTIASLPWILVYVYGNMIVAILAILIAFGTFQGYKIFKGRMGRGVPAIISIISILIVVFITVVICPIIILQNNNLDISLKELTLLYQNKNVQNAIIQDLIVALLFTILGIAGVIRSIKLQIKSGSKDIKFTEQPLVEEAQKQLQNASTTIKKAFETLNALDKENAVTKSEVINELVITYEISEKEAKNIFSMLVNSKVIRKEKGKYYFDINSEEELKYMAPYKINKKGTVITVLIIIVALVIFTILGVINSRNEKKSEKINIPNTNIEINLDKSFVLYNTVDEIQKTFGEVYAQYYDFIVLEANNEVEIYATIINKEDLEEEYNLLELIEMEKEYANENYKEVSEILSRNIGNREFKYYTYIYGENLEYIGNLCLVDCGETYLFLDCYADVGNQEKIDELLNTVFK